MAWVGFAAYGTTPIMSIRDHRNNVDILMKTYFIKQPLSQVVIISINKTVHVAKYPMHPIQVSMPILLNFWVDCQEILI